MKLTAENFKEIISGSKTVLVDFWAEWCGPCRMVSPIIEELEEEYSGKAVVGKVNVDEEGALALEYGVVSIPTVLVFHDGKEAERLIGAHSQDEYEDILDKYTEN